MRHHCSYYNADNFRFSLSCAMEAAVQTPDVPLLSFAAMKRALEAQIQSGNLRGIDEMDFGYLPFYTQKGGSKEWLLAPVWRVLGGYSENGESDQNVMPYHDPRDTDGSLSVPAEYGYYYYNAQTGEMLPLGVGDTPAAKNSLPLGTVISWQDAGGQR